MYTELFKLVYFTENYFNITVLVIVHNSFPFFFSSFVLFNDG